MSEVIVFPDFQKLKEEVERLRTELSMLLLNRDELQLVICKNIEMEYVLKFGALEHRVYDMRCQVLRLKRKMELMQANKNRQEKIDLSKIEATLDAEFEEYQQKLNEQINRMNDAIARSKAKVLSEEDNQRLKKMYRTVVKVLHPDLHENLMESQVQLFMNAVNAYENGDLKTLEVIYEMVRDDSIPELDEDAMSYLVKEKERLQKLVTTIKTDIEKIKSEYPYSVKDIVADEEQVEKRKQELEAILSEYKEAKDMYEERIKELLR